MSQEAVNQTLLHQLTSGCLPASDFLRYCGFKREDLSDVLQLWMNVLSCFYRLAPQWIRYFFFFLPFCCHRQVPLFEKSMRREACSTQPSTRRVSGVPLSFVATSAEFQAVCETEE